MYLVFNLIKLILKKGVLIVSILHWIVLSVNIVIHVDLYLAGFTAVSLLATVFTPTFF